MSELKKYYPQVHYFDQGQARVANPPMYMAHHVDAELQRLRQEKELLQRAVEWCLENGATRYHLDVDATGDGGICDDQGNDIEVPPELAPYILADK